MKTPRINQTIKRIAAAIFLTTVVSVSVAAVARADGTLTPQEQRFGEAISGSLCEYIDSAGINNMSMTEAMEIIYRNTPANMDMSDAVDIINYVVYVHCPNHWDELVAFGEGARSSYA